MTLPPNLTDRQRRYMEMYLANSLTMSSTEVTKMIADMKQLQLAMTDEEWNGIMDLLDPRRKSR